MGAEIRARARLAAWVFALWALPAAALCTAAVDAQEASLFSAGASASLEQRFGGGGISWILMDASGQVVGEHWDDVERPVAPGSLMKPFVALAYGEEHGGRFPREFCAGTSGRCWYPAGHGRLGLEDALAESCNAYFLALAREVNGEDAKRTFARLGLDGPPQASPETLIGLDSAWLERPVVLARAYLALLREARPEIRDRIVAGMQAAAMRGTAREVDAALGARAALAKTGTAACGHRPRAAADGFTVVLYPAVQPRLLLLVRMHGATGARTSSEAGAMLRAIGMGER